jgi:hypothetical protein
VHRHVRFFEFRTAARALLDQGRGDSAGADGVHADTLGRELERRRTGQANDTVLGSRVRGHFLHPNEAANRG